MLVIKPYLNYNSIDDEIWIQNIDDDYDDISKYLIKKPEGYENYEIHHRRVDGWRILTEKALRILNNE